MTRPPVRIGSLHSLAEFRAALAELQLELPTDDRILAASEGSPMAEPLRVGPLVIGNRWCIHPMEGWDGDAGGGPSEHTIRRWRNFGLSGAKLLWGGEAFAVRPDGRANPNQLCRRPENDAALARLLDEARQAHASLGMGADFVVGLQLTHSGRWCKPHEKTRFAPRIAYHHPLLDRRVGVAADDDGPILQDADLRQLVDDYVAAARLAERSGFEFVDVKCCHGYLLHEFLTAFRRPGPYGGDFEGRTRLLREIIAAIRTECPRLQIGVRLSIFDQGAYRPDPAQTTGRRLGPGVRETADDVPVGFGCDAVDPQRIDLSEPIALIQKLRDAHEVRLFNLTAGSPYYNPHTQRPALYPPSDGYQPPEDPLVGCVRQIQAARTIKQACPNVITVGTAYTYFQEYIAHVAQGVIRDQWIDSVGLGRLVLSDWAYPAKTLAGRDPAEDRKLCRTFSDCTTAPRNGLISGCYPLDDYYKRLPEAAELKQLKAR